MFYVFWFPRVDNILVILRESVRSFHLLSKQCYDATLSVAILPPGKLLSIIIHYYYYYYYYYY